MLEIGKWSVYAKYCVGFVGVGCTLIVSPWFTFDPINIPKMLFLSFGAIGLIPYLIFCFYKREFSDRFAALSSLLFVTMCVFSLIEHNGVLEEQFWGTWGRSTGFLTYFSLVIVFLASIVISREIGAQFLLKSFHRTSYFISFYTFLQYLELDPINWSQKLPVATLGNINFMSAFLGMASASFFLHALFEKANIITRFHFSALTLINIFLIWKSGSIQGIAMCLLGISAVLFVYIKQRFGNMRFFMGILLYLSIFSLVILGSFGLGPLGSKLIQETLLFRLDYWRAGWQMTRDNWMYGVGMDRYGEYYRFYRDQEAVDRTGPQRVTNTAHNIFLDISSGAGIIPGVILLGLILVTLFQLYRKISSASFELESLDLFAYLFCFLAFCLISINQIGVGVWGFIFLGLARGSLNKMKSRSNLRAQDKSFTRLENQKNTKRFNGLLVTAIGMFFGFLLAIPAVSADARYLNAYKNGTALELVEVLGQPGMTSFHYEKTLEVLVSRKEDSEAKALAELALYKDDRNFYAWSVICFNPLTSDGEKKVAARKLVELDPRNEALKSDLAKFLNND